MKYYLIAGEASGDLHGANLVKALKKSDPEAEIRGIGGDRMETAGTDLFIHYKELAYMGFWEVIAHLSTILHHYRRCKLDLQGFQPDAVVLIDYPGFNLRMAKFAKENNYKVFYYISPKIWAWNKSRIKKIKKFVDQMYVILPFEKEFYRKNSYEVEFVGHPLMDEVTSFRPDQDFKSKTDVKKPVIAILPGSRKQEINKILPELLKVPSHFPDHEFVIAGLSELGEGYYNSFQNINRVKVVYDQTYDLLSVSAAALVTSGTATLEAALFEVPQVVCYKTGSVTYFIAKKMINVKYISLVNLIIDEEVIKELIQNDMNEQNLVNELQAVLPGGEEREELKIKYKRLKNILGETGASEKTANLIMNTLSL